MNSLLTDLRTALGSQHVLTDPVELAPMLIDNRGRWHGSALCAVFPATTDEVAQIMRIARRYSALVFTQGGNTGNVAGATPVVKSADVCRSIIVSTKRMRKIESVDTLNDSIVVQAGVPVAVLRQAAADADRLFALSLASDGTATVGGILAANAGGVHVVRYGNAREQCLGLEAVLADGRVLNLMRGLRKDNTGYALKDLFIGSEGSLGIITRAVLKLHPLPADRSVLWLSLDSIHQVERVFEKMREVFGNALSAFEIIHQTPLKRVAQVFPERLGTLNTSAPWSALVELSYCTLEETQRSSPILETVLEQFLEEGLLLDAVVAQNQSQCDALWIIRESVPEAHKKTGGNVKHDVSVPRSSLACFVEKTNSMLKARFEWIEPSVFGHFGDGNLHYNMGVVPGFDPRLCFVFEKEINAIVYDQISAFNGSIAAEHGIGRMKRELLEKTKPQIELQLMRSIKRVLDPDNRLNPGAVIEPSDQNL